MQPHRKRAQRLAATVPLRAFAGVGFEARLRRKFWRGALRHKDTNAAARTTVLALVCEELAVRTSAAGEMGGADVAVWSLWAEEGLQ